MYEGVTRKKAASPSKQAKGGTGHYQFPRHEDELLKMR